MFAFIKDNFGYILGAILTPVTWYIFEAFKRTQFSPLGFIHIEANNRGRCRRCFSVIDLKTWDYCPYCGRQLRGNKKIWHNFIEWFRVDPIWIKSPKNFGVISYAIYVVKLLAKNIMSYRREYTL